VRVCETCKHRSEPPQELLDLYSEVSKYYPRVYYCSKLQVIKCYNPERPSQLFDCEHYEKQEA
jgi:ribosome-associated toxin RatA of RatAB toxin-antitoxin module